MSARRKSAPVYVFAETLFERIRDAGDAETVTVSIDELREWKHCAEVLETELLVMHEERLS